MHENEVTKSRRERFMDTMGSGVAVFPAAPPRVRSNDTEYRYRPESDLFYLTGFGEPDSVAVLAPEHPDHKFVLFVRPRDPEREVWDGKRAGVGGAMAEYGADAAYPISELEARLPEYLDGRERLFYRLGRDEDFDLRIIRMLNTYRTSRRAKGPGPSSILDPGEIVHEMRLIKSDTDVALMRRAIEISADAHRAAMAAARPGMYEYELEALIEYTFRRSGASGPSYSSIVGSGPNATTLHYVENTRRIGENELVLVDAGAEYACYAADITRTWPASGRFTEEQRAIYEIVLAAQTGAIEMSKPGITMQDVHDFCVRTIADGLVRLGLLEGPVEKVIEAETYKKFYMHKTGHYLGMDVHDVGKYRQGEEWRPLAAGMVMTVEPGIYIAEDCPDVDERWRGIGVRIEDDVLITETGHEVLSAGAPKTVQDLESIVGTAATAGAGL